MAVLKPSERCPDLHRLRPKSEPPRTPLEACSQPLRCISNKLVARSFVHLILLIASPSLLLEAASSQSFPRFPLIVSFADPAIAVRTARIRNVIFSTHETKAPSHARSCVEQQHALPTWASDSWSIATRSVGENSARLGGFAATPTANYRRQRRRAQGGREGRKRVRRPSGRRGGFCSRAVGGGRVRG